VLDVCRNRAPFADSSFAAAIVAFQKAAAGCPAGASPSTSTSPSPYRAALASAARHAADAAAFNRSLALWRRGSVAAAVERWLGHAAPGAGADAAALGAAEAAEKAAAAATPREQRVGAAHVLGALSDAQRTTLTAACVAVRVSEAAAAQRKRLAAAGHALLVPDDD
jgi:hypothetical protein